MRNVNIGFKGVGSRESGVGFFVRKPGGKYHDIPSGNEPRFRSPTSYTLLLILFFTLVSCSFDYGNQESADNDQPDIVMEDVEYMRVRSGDPVARFMAEKVQRFEERRIMELLSFSFEQYEKKGLDVNACGRGGSAEFMIDSGDIKMDNGIQIEVESEDVTIVTKQLEWIDKEHTLSGGPAEPATVLRANGTSFTGYGFFANARRRTWEFSGGAGGSYIHNDEKEEETAETR